MYNFRNAIGELNGIKISHECHIENTNLVNVENISRKR